MSFHLSKANIQQFSDFDKVLGFTAEEEKTVISLAAERLPAKRREIF